jgi:MFS family permease
MSFTSADPPCSRWPDVYLVAGARGISRCGDFLAATALALSLQTAGAGGLAVSGLMLAATVPLVVLAPLTGRLADRIDSRRLLVAAGFGQAAVCAVLAYVEEPALIIALVALLACGLAVTQPTLAALLPQMVRREDLPRASAINQTAGMLGLLAGPALAGLLVGHFGVRLPLLVDAASYLFLVVAGVALRTRRGGSAHAESAGGKPAVGAWRLRDDRLVLAMAVAITGVVAGVGAINVIEVFFVRETLSASTTAFGVVAASWTGGMLAGAWVFARTVRRVPSDASLVLVILFLLAGACLVVLAAAGVPAAGWLVPLWLLGGLFNGGESVYYNVVVARRVPAAARGRAFASIEGAVQGAAMLGYLLGGALLEFFPPRPLVAACGVGGLAAVVAVLPTVMRAIRVKPGAHEPTPASDEGSGLVEAEPVTAGPAAPASALTASRPPPPRPRAGGDAPDTVSS